MPRGGVRCGAGRPAKRKHIESYDRIRVRDVLRAASRARLKGWNAGTEEPGVRVEHARLVAAQEIALTSTPCHYGGTRWWFLCPGCAKRVGVLVLRGQRYVCRHCAEVSYRSQAADAISRSWRRQRRLERRLGADPLVKPTGMHWSTFHRLRTEIQQIEAARMRIWVAGVLTAFPHLRR